MRTNSLRRRRGIPALLGLTIAAAPLVAAAPAQAAIASPFKPVFSVNAPGDIVLVGNTVMTCGPNLRKRASGYGLQEPYATLQNCIDARQGIATSSLGDGTLNNNIYDMQYVDVDGDPSTFNSSSSDLVIPEGASIAYAGLYWGGSNGGEGDPGVPDPSKKGEVLFKVPGHGYQTINSATTAGNVNAEGTLMAPSADVTKIVRAAGSGTYSVANIQASTGVGVNGGWSLVVAYTSDKEPMRNLTVFSGYGNVEKPNANDPYANDATMDVSGFTTPLAGTVRTRMGVVAFEGDRGISGDTFQLNGVAISDRLNKATNAFNSVISDMGQYVTNRTPNDINNFGIDVKRYSVTGFLKNKATSARIRLTTDSDGYGPRVVTFATELYAPDVQVAQSVVDTNAGTLREGDTVKYTLTTSNKGGDNATNATIAQAIPAGLTYKAESARIDGKVVNATYDAATQTLTFPVGTLAMKESRSLTFEATLDKDVQDQLVLPSTADVTYDAQVSGQHFKGYSNTVQVVADVPRADLAVSSTVTPGVVEASAPGSVTYTVEVSNLGPRSAVATQLATSLPKGAVVTSVKGATCQTTLCTLGEIPTGETRTVTIVADVKDVTEATATTFTASSSTPDPAAGNNSSTTNFAVGHAPVAVGDEISTPANKEVTLDVLANDTDADGDKLTVTSVSQGEHGSVTLNPDGTVTYKPTSGYVGADSYSYQVSDGVFTRTATVKVTVNAPAPTAVNDEAKVSRSEVSIDVLANDVSPLGGDLKIVSVNDGPLGGTARVVTTESGETRVVYTPPARNVGVDTLTYVVEDAYGQQSTAKVEVTVTNEAPVIVQGPEVSVSVGSTPAKLDLVDPDGDASSIRNIKGLPEGLTLNPDGTWGGKATKPGTSEVTFQVCDDRSPAACTDVTLRILVDGKGGTDGDGDNPVPTDGPTTPPVPTDGPTTPTDEPTTPTDGPTTPPVPTDEPTYPVPTNGPVTTTPPVPTDEPTYPVPTNGPVTTTPPVPTDEPTTKPVPVPTPMPTDDPVVTPVPTDEPTTPVDTPTTPVPVDEPTTPVPVDEPTTPVDTPTTPVPTDEPTTKPVPPAVKEEVVSTPGQSATPAAVTPSSKPTGAPAPRNQAQAPEQLAYTGAPVGLLVGAGLLLMGAGVFLMRRSRA